MKRTRLIFLLLFVLLMALVVSGCKEGNSSLNTTFTTRNRSTSSKTNTKSAVIEDDDADKNAYVSKYSDINSMDEWYQNNIENCNYPPTTFKVGETFSNDLEWTKMVVGNQTIIDYEDEAPQKRFIKTVMYDCEEIKLRVIVDYTSYEGYPVIEYESTLYNLSEGNSDHIKDLLTFDAEVEKSSGGSFVHANRGAMMSYYDFEPVDYNMDKKNVHITSDDGRATNSWLPFFNIENKVNNNGTIVIINWEGTWKADFTKTSTGIKCQAGQLSTSFVLQEGESMTFPGGVLLFYKGDYSNGQNVYRRWLYNCNLFRYQEKHMKNTNILVCGDLGSSVEQSYEYLDFLVENDMIQYLEKFNIDAGWYDFEGHDWMYTGNWRVDENLFPDGMMDLSDAIHEAGLEFALWFEPERIRMGTDAANELGEKIIAVGKRYENIPIGENCIIDYGDDEVVDYVLQMLLEQMSENGVDQYRQDYNVSPAPFFNSKDNFDSVDLGIPRVGITENKYYLGYRKMFRNLISIRPDLYVDACAGGGRRYNLETMRFAFLHSRSDNAVEVESAQIQTYGSANWFMYWGSGIAAETKYDLRSHIGNGLGVGINSKNVDVMKELLKEFRYFADYLFYDFYQLSEYVSNSKKPSAIQFDSPEEGKGITFTYFRSGDSFVLKPKGLDPKAKYIVWDYDDPDNSKRMILGSKLMEGIVVSGETQEAKVFEYKLADGENTSAFQKEEVKTGPGSTNYNPEENNTSLIDVRPPESTKSYLPKGLTDEMLYSLHDIEDDNTIKYIGPDYRSTGTIYAISSDIYESLSYSGYLVNGWRAIDKSRFGIYVDSLSDPSYQGASPIDVNFNVWDYWYYVNQPFAKKIGTKCFLWLADTVGLGDSDGGWQNYHGSITWTDKKNEKHFAELDIHFDAKEYQQIKFNNVDDYDSKGKIFEITEEMFGSFVYSGKGLIVGTDIWYQLDSIKVGICSFQGKAIIEGNDVLLQTKFVNEFDNEEAGIFTLYKDGHYYIWFKDYSEYPLYSSSSMAYPSRAYLVWYNENNEICMQGFLR